LNQSAELKNKIDDITQAFVSSTVSKETFIQTADVLNEKLSELSLQIDTLQDDELYEKSGRKVIEFMKILETYDDMLNNSPKEEKSSQLY
jgi:hypothetical protein